MICVASKLVPKQAVLKNSKSGKGVIFTDKHGYVYTARMIDMVDFMTDVKAQVDFALLVDETRKNY